MAPSKSNSNHKEKQTKEGLGELTWLGGPPHLNLNLPNNHQKAKQKETKKQKQKTHTHTVLCVWRHKHTNTRTREHFSKPMFQTHALKNREFSKKLRAPLKIGFLPFLFLELSGAIRIDSRDSNRFARIGHSSDSGESAWRAMKIGFQLRMIRANRLVRIARAAKFESLFLRPASMLRFGGFWRPCLGLERSVRNPSRSSDKSAASRNPDSYRVFCVSRETHFQQQLAKHPVSEKLVFLNWCSEEIVRYFL